MREELAGLAFEFERLLRLLGSHHAFAFFQKKAAHVYAGQGIVGMPDDGFFVSDQRGLAMSGGDQHVAEVVQRRQMIGLAQKHFDVVVSGLDEPAQFG